MIDIGAFSPGQVAGAARYIGVPLDQADLRDYWPGPGTRKCASCVARVSHPASECEKVAALIAYFGQCTHSQPNRDGEIWCSTHSNLFPNASAARCNSAPSNPVLA